MNIKLLSKFDILKSSRFLVIAVLAATNACAKPVADEKEMTQIDLPVDEEIIDRLAPQPRSFAPIIGDAQKAVVSVYTANVVKVVNSASSREEEMLRRFFGMPSPRQQQPSDDEDYKEQRVPQGIGSGVIVREDGYVLTNSHVITSQNNEIADEVLVMLNDGRELQAEVIAKDDRTDVAILKVDATDLPYLSIADSDNIEIGDIVFAIGNPMGVGQTVTQGIVSATERSIGIYGPGGYENFIQTDASINRGNSGGALIDVDGRLIGINSAILSQTGGSVGIGFAIPSNLAVAITGQLTKFGEVRRGFLGVQISDLSPELAESFELDSTDGAVVDKVIEGLPAEAAGILNGDVIISVNGKKVKSRNQLRIKIGQIVPGTEVEIGYIRDGEKHTVLVNVGDMAEAGSTVSGKIMEGVSTQLVNDELRDEYGISKNVEGIVITDVDPGVGYARKLREGMVIIEINGRPVESEEAARDALRSGVNRFYVYDRGQVGYVAIRIP
ncbi:Do family serine endopeptidase [Puniceicoccaceae bacterium K14]|nr:Do family serine endopeptidase [Puniceicoccaceae bacterium K14]